MGLIYLYTGDGEGKSTCAFGHALRAVGHGQKVVVIQFMKGRSEIGEVLFESISPSLYEIHQFGNEEFVFEPTEKDIQLAQQGLEFAKEKLSEEPFILILDELNVVLSKGLLELDEVIKLLKGIPEKTNIIITGRNAPKKLIEIADLVTEMREIKHPYSLGKQAEEGMDF
ncbi:MAG: cob(I)yrinic acid a,c-diamide adenosyltransferase [Candidatus Diapherotrites archaeon]|nr:cob(I)yrinic acid a,c-diamide adenosyltransferase [Candidatus Diapherotrites archaeon]